MMWIIGFLGFIILASLFSSDDDNKNDNNTENNPINNALNNFSNNLDKFNTKLANQNKIQEDTKYLRSRLKFEEEMLDIVVQESKLELKLSKNPSLKKIYDRNWEEISKALEKRSKLPSKIASLQVPPPPLYIEKTVVNHTYYDQLKEYCESLLDDRFYKINSINRRIGYDQDLRKIFINELNDSYVPYLKDVFLTKEPLKKSNSLNYFSS